MIPGMSADFEIFVKNVRRLILKRDISAIELARRAHRITGIAPRTVTAALQGVPKSARMDTASAICSALKVPLSLMLIPDIDLELLENDKPEQLLKNLSKVPAEGRRYIYAVAERESSYTPRSPSE